MSEQKKETKIRVLGDRVLVIADDKEKMTKTGLHIPDTVEERPVTGLVINCGSKCSQIKDGDRIWFGSGAGSDVEFYDKKYIIMRESDVVAIL